MLPTSTRAALRSFGIDAARLFRSNRANRHFHCARPGCGYSFVRYSNMAQHEAKHRGEANNNNNNNQDSETKPDVRTLSPSSPQAPLRESK